MTKSSHSTPANRAKACFDNIYDQPTPHEYLDRLSALDYSICDETKPFTAELVARLRSADRQPRILDIACSYGINAALLRHGVSFRGLARTFASRVPRDREAAVAATRQLARLGPTATAEWGGLDASAPAIAFARDARLLDQGIVADLERHGAELEAADQQWVRGVDLLLATGAVGYVTGRTFAAVLGAMGERARDAIVLMTVLRVFDPAPIASALRRFGLETMRLPDVLLSQRRFHPDGEQARVLEVLAARGLHTRPESEGRLRAEVWVAARPERVETLIGALRRVALRQSPERGSARVAAVSAAR